MSGHNVTETRRRNDPPFLIRKSGREYPPNPEATRQMDARRQVEIRREALALGLSVEELHGGQE